MRTVPLPDGLVLRPATDADIDAIVALYVQAFGEQDGADVRAFLAEPEIFRAWSVVADGSRVASAIGRIDHRMQLDGFEFPVAQIEYVATDPDHRRKGLVAAQMAWHHEACAAEGIDVQMIGGIPYFYRQFGYGYGLADPTLFLFDREHVASVPAAPLKVRSARSDDLDAFVRLEDERPTLGLRMLRDERVWRRTLAMCEANPLSEMFVAEDDDGAIAGWAQTFDHPREGRSFLFSSVARSADAVTALVRAALDRAGELLVVGFDSPETVWGDQLRVLGAPFRHAHGYYVRIADPRRFLETLRPVLSSRLAASQFANASGSLEISLYTTGIAIDYEHGTITAIRDVPAVEDPTDVDGIGVAPDWFPALVFGRWKATDLAEHVDDVIILRDHKLMNVLFPFRSSDVSGDF